MLYGRFCKIIITSLVFFAAFSTFAAPSHTLSANINTIIKRFNSDVDTGIYVRSLNSGKLLYSRNIKRLFMPASVLKVFTAVAALDYLGSDYTFTTKIIAKKNAIHNGKLKDDLYFYFDGDPSLKRDELNSLVLTLSKKGIKEITGNVYIDDTIFDDKSYGPGWMWDEKNFCYAAPTSAIMVNKNCFPFKIIAAEEEGHPATVINYPENSFVPIISSVITKKTLYDDCPLDLNVGDDNVYRLSGCIKPKRHPTLLIGVKNIRLFAKQLIGQMLEENNIKLKGIIDFAKAPSLTKEINEKDQVEYTVLAKHKSESLSSLVTTMLKKSDNLIADALYKKLGNKYWHKRATWKNGGRAVTAILTKKCPYIDFKKMHMVDGSGLSHYNLVTPGQIGKLLSCAYHDKKLRKVFYSALPISGVDGSLKHRMRKGLIKSKVHAKTGTMKNISSLAGYVTTKKGHKVVFVVMANDFLEKISKCHKMQDSICRYLATHVK